MFCLANADNFKLFVTDRVLKDYLIPSLMIASQTRIIDN